MSQSTQYKLKEIARIVNGSTPSTSCDNYYDGDIIWLTPRDLSEQKSKYIEKGSRNITEDGYNSCSTQLIPPYSLLLTSRAPIGLLAINKVECCTNQGFKYLILDKSKVDVDYLYYYLKFHIKEIEALGAGTTFKEVSKSSLENYVVSLPSVEEQRIVARILSDIDSKIAIDRSISSNLSRLARQIYDYWFVLFDFPNIEGKPYQSSGGQMAYNDILKRVLPFGWSVKPIKEICSIRRGASPRPIDDYMDETHTGKPWLKISDATVNSSPFVVKIKEYIIPEGINKSVEVDEGTLVVTNSATPGLPKFIHVNACVHDGWLVLTDYPQECKYYLYYTIEDMRAKLERMASGSIFKNLRTDYLENYFCMLPSSEILKAFNHKISPIMERLLSSEKEICALTQQRDILLPLLMNGQISNRK